MEKFNYPEHRDDTLGWAFIAIMAAQNEASNKDLDDWYNKARERGYVEIELKFDGHEYNFSTVIRRLKDEFNHQVLKKAKELIKERTGSLISKLYRLENSIDDIESTIDDIENTFDGVFQTPRNG